MRRTLSLLVTALLLSLLVLAQAPAPSQVPAAASSSQALETRVESILSQMTLEEKIDLLGGVEGFYIRGLPRLGLPRLKMADGPIGVRNYGPGTTMAGGIALAATWNLALAERVGTEIGRDARAKGVHFLLGPGVNLHRSPMNGRNFEYFGEDPFLASRIAVGYINGVQRQGVSATIKHFMGNNSEFDRHNTDSVIDDRALREIYLPVFEAAVKEAHVGAVMDSYNLTNGVRMTENTRLNSDILKAEWGFDGVLMSDWGATYDAVAAANAGLDLEMPSGAHFNRQNLLAAVQQGKVAAATIDDKVRRILRLAARFGWLDREQTDLSIPRYNQEGRRVALQAAREGMVLLKNEGNLLPLSKEKIKNIAVIGPDAYPAVTVGGGSARVQPFAAVSFLEGISNFLGTSAKVTYNRGIPTLAEMAQSTILSGMTAEYFTDPDLQGTPVATRAESRIDFAGAGGGFGGGQAAASGTPVPDQWRSARWTGRYGPSLSPDGYNIFVECPSDNCRYRLFVDDKLALDHWQHAGTVVSYATTWFDRVADKRLLTADNRTGGKIVLEHSRQRGRGAPRIRLGIVSRASIVDPEAKALAAKADAVVLAVGFDPETETEGTDRSFRLPPGQEQLIQEIAKVNKNMIVVITSGGAVDMNAWLDRVPAVLEAWYPGQEGGTALAEILFGAVNPSGRLPVSFEKREEDNPARANYYPEPGTSRVVYKEGIFVGYRGFEHTGTKPLFPFGFGLSYTTFHYGKLKILNTVAQILDQQVLLNGGCQLSFDVTNTGQREGAEVAQVYLAKLHSDVLRPVKELKGFAKVTLRPGQTQHVEILLNDRAFSHYDVKTKQWFPDVGDYEILVGRSSADIVLRTKVMLPAGIASSGGQSGPAPMSEKRLSEPGTLGARNPSWLPAGDE